MVYSVKAVAELPLACPLTATPTARLAPPPDTPGSTTYKLRVIILLVGMIPSRTEIMLSLSKVPYYTPRWECDKPF